MTSALDGGEWSASRPGRFTPREKAPGTQWTGGCVGPRAVFRDTMTSVEVTYISRKFHHDHEEGFEMKQ
jgi:hypothetical protein